MPAHLEDVFAGHRVRYRSAGHWRNESLAGTFLAAADRQPAQRWHFYEGEHYRTVTLRELLALAAGCADDLRVLGHAPGDVVAVRAVNSLEAAVAYFGAALADLTVMVASPRESVAAVAPLLDMAGVRTVIVVRGPDAEEALAAPGRSFEDVAVLGGPAPAGARSVTLHEEEPGEPPENADGFHAVAYTSGSTAIPKAVVYTDSQLLFETRALRSTLETPGGLLVPSPVGHVTGLLNLLLLPLLRPGPVVSMDRWNAARAVELARRHGCVEVRGTTLYVQAMAEVADDLGGIRVGMVGGGPVAPDLVRRLDGRGVRLVRSYGSTEHPTVSSSFETDPLAARAGTDGRVFPGTEVRLVDGDGTPVAPGAPGEILSRGPDAACGYLDPALDRAGYDEDRWLRTGDLGRLDDAERLTVVDRVKDVIIRAGENISAKEVEDLLHEMPGLAEVAVIGMPDDRYGERVCAFAVVTASVDLDGINRFLASKGLERYKWLEHLKVVDDLPRTPSGKVRKQVLREQVRSLSEARS